mmetsp:Transcript_13214/g.23536  ORF Transcript_13214/g.23536 Transcript_13214/m.23536 type:complete len:208 (-) Transcript_13214:3799-4422(-)
MKRHSSRDFEAMAGRSVSAKSGASLMATKKCSSWQRCSASAASFLARERLCQRLTTSNAAQSLLPEHSSMAIRLSSSSHTFGRQSKASHFKELPSEATGKGRLPPGSSTTARRVSTLRWIPSPLSPAVTACDNVGAASTPQPPSSVARVVRMWPEGSSTAAVMKAKPDSSSDTPPVTSSKASADSVTSPSAEGRRSETVMGGRTKPR